MFEIKETVCACDICKGFCRRRPCWPTPDEARRLIDKGYADRLMVDYWSGDGFDGGDIYLLCPAIVGHEQNIAPFMPVGRCTFLTDNELCELHDPGLKPIEGRIASCKFELDSKKEHWKVVATWNNKNSQDFVDKWRRRIRGDVR